MTGADKSLSKKFQEYLLAAGADVLPVTNCWEVARFRTSTATSVVYQNAKGRVTYSDAQAHEAFSAYSEKRQWSAIEKVERVRRKTVEELLIERDGENCFFCNCLFDTGTRPTLEHLLSIKHGGCNHLSNLVLACKPCNEAAGSLPIIEKVKLREARQSWHAPK